MRGWFQREFIEDGNTFFSSESRQTGYGVGIRAFVTDDLFLEAQGTRLESDFGGGFSSEETLYALQIGWEF